MPPETLSPPASGFDRGQPSATRGTRIAALVAITLVVALVAASTIAGLAPWARRAQSPSLQAITVRLALRQLSCPSEAV
ncbi:MAG: hypothetical protein IVW57_15395 [Ktedonobacterales bacterium]|nr:hypothetical protein [Ktedonobacterales bacterium]